MSLASSRVGIALAFAFVVVPSVVAAQPSGAAPEPPPAPPPSDAPAHGTGLLLELRHEAAEANVIREPFGGSLNMPEPRGAIFAGYQGRRWSFGLGLQLAREIQSTDDDTTLDDFYQTTFMLVPGARVALGRSDDGRAELVGIVDLGVGESRRSSNDGANEVVVERFLLQFGPGVRYWLGPSFAFGASALIRHARNRVETDDPFDNDDPVAETAITGLVTSLHVTGVF